MKIDDQWLDRQNACQEGKTFFLREGILTLDEGVRNLIAKDKLEWANWLVTHAMSHSQKIGYAIYAAKQVIRIYEKYDPTDGHPRLAIWAALRFAKNPNEKNRMAANAAAYAAANAANAAANAANAAAYAAAYVANAATYAAANKINETMKIKIILYGLRILKLKETH